MKGKSHLRFEKLAAFYDIGLRIIFAPCGGEKRLRDRILGLLPLAEGHRLLDVGCGTGTVSLMAAERVGTSGTVVGVEPSGEMLARAQEKVRKAALPQVTLLHGPGSPLPFPDASFDAAVFFLVLHEMAHEDRIDSLREAVRVLKPGGEILAGELAYPEHLLPRMLMKLILLMEEEEAADFLKRSIDTVVAEAAGDGLLPVRRETFLWGLAQGVLYRKR